MREGATSTRGVTWLPGGSSSGTEIPNRCVPLTARKSTPRTSNQGESSMDEDGNTRGSRRYVALDIHKHYCIIAAVDREGRVVLHPVRVEHADLEGWLKKNLRGRDQVV